MVPSRTGLEIMQSNHQNNLDGESFERIVKLISLVYAVYRAMLEVGDNFRLQLVRRYSKAENLD